MSNKCTKGQGKKLILNDEKFIKRIVDKDPFISAVKVRIEVEKNRRKSVSTETIRRSIRSFGLNGRAVRKKPYISPKNRKAKLVFARIHLNKSYEFRRQVKHFTTSKICF